MQFDFGFRIDTGNKIGSGHFFRCLSIAKELQQLSELIKKIVVQEYLRTSQLSRLRNYGNKEH